ncbi:hypothetical protein [Paludisphaera soli]|uniref:hypothetical protein n=1 Tax=Paludisphaera soli TaxID=2712865 RepID=UPI0013EC856A|nr:hypothetical protein [Paludisphaera soli]
MDAGELMAKLDKIRFFEAYTPEAEKKARARVLKQYKEGLAGESRKYFERFPGFALCFLGVDMELDGAEDLKLVLKQFAADTFGLFKPTHVKAVRDRDKDVTRLEFRVDGVPYKAEAGYEGWVPDEVFQVIVKAFKTHCNKLGFHAVIFPEFSQEATMTVCTARAFKAAVKAGLLPADYHQAYDPSEYGEAASEEA